MVEKGALPLLIGFKLALFRSFFFRLVKKIMPQQGTHYKSKQPAERNTEQVEYNNAGNARVLALPIAGLMSQSDGYTLAREYAELDAWTKDVLGCTLRAPFMVLSFLALPVIPSLKMTDLGLFDVERFGFVEVVE